MDLRTKTCCFTEHRSLTSGEKLKATVRLRKAIDDLIKQGIMLYSAGGALGFDRLVARMVLDMKKEYPQFRLIQVLPCENQTRGWRSEDITVYVNIKRRSDKVAHVSREYASDCMHRQNRHLADHSGNCIFYLTRSSSGTAYTVDYDHLSIMRCFFTVLYEKVIQENISVDECAFPIFISELFEYEFSTI